MLTVGWVLNRGGFIILSPRPKRSTVAAEALCRVDREDEALPVLLEAFVHESAWGRLQAANSLDRFGEKGRPAIEVMRKAADDQSRENMFVRAVVTHTLKQLGHDED